MKENVKLERLFFKGKNGATFEADIHVTQERLSGVTAYPKLGSGRIECTWSVSELIEYVQDHNFKIVNAKSFKNK